MIGTVWKVGLSSAGGCFKTVNVVASSFDDVRELCRHALEVEYFPGPEGEVSSQAYEVTSISKVMDVDFIQTVDDRVNGRCAFRSADGKESVVI